MYDNLLSLFLDDQVTKHFEDNVVRPSSTYFNVHFWSKSNQLQETHPVESTFWDKPEKICSTDFKSIETYIS